MTIQLYCFGESGNAYKVALSLALSDTPWEARYVDFFKGENRTPEFAELNEMGEVPVLVDGDTTLTQSGVMLDYLSEKHGRFGGTTPEEKREIWRWILWDNYKFTNAASTGRFLGNFFPPEKLPEGLVPFYQGRFKAAAKVLESHLTERDWIVGSNVTNADLSCCGYLFYPEEFGFDRSAWPNISRWLDRIAALPGWKHPYDLMPGSPADRTA